MTDTHQLSPNWAVPPGATIHDILTERNLSHDTFAAMIGIPTAEITKIIEGDEEITFFLAQKLETVLGGSSTFWLSREKQYRDDLLRLTKIFQEDMAKEWVRELPTADMIKFGWIPPSSNITKKIEACYKFFDVANINKWQEKYQPILNAVAFRTTSTYSSKPSAVLAWLRQGEILSRQIECKEWNAKKFLESMNHIKKLTRIKAPQIFIPKLQQICAECGVALIILRAPNGCSASGATRFISDKKAILMLSFRYLSDDQFWFSFFHESGHLILHDKESIFLEDNSDALEELEEEANEFAENIIIPLSEKGRLLNCNINKNEILKLAQYFGVSRGLIVGQLQYSKKIPYNKFNWLKRRYKWSDVEY